MSETLLLIKITRYTSLPKHSVFYSAIWKYINLLQSVSLIYVCVCVISPFVNYELFWGVLLAN